MNQYKSFVEQHVKGMNGLGRTCTPAASTDTGIELVGYCIENFRAAVFMGDINLAIGARDAIRTACKLLCRFSLCPFLDACHMFFRTVSNVEYF